MSSQFRPSPPPPSAALPPDIPPRWGWHYQTLLALRTRLQAERAAHAAEAAEPLDEAGVHPGEVATDESTHSVTLTLLASEENALAEVEAALQRLHRGVYGICEATGARIPAARLRALPWCRCTVGAARSREAPSPLTPTPHAQKIRH